jgi:hypothetical protein
MASWWERLSLRTCKHEYISLGKHLGVDYSHLKAFFMWDWNDEFLCLEPLLHDYMDHSPQAETLCAIVEKLEGKSHHTFKSRYLACMHGEYLCCGLL